MKRLLLLLPITLSACDPATFPVGRIEFVEKMQNCPMMSFGAKNFCLKNKDHACHQICEAAPSCCGLYEVFEKNPAHEDYTVHSSFQQKIATPL